MNMQAKSVEITFGRLVTWALSVVTLVVVTLATCVANDVRADIDNLRLADKDSATDRRETAEALVRIDEKYNALIITNSQILTEIQQLREEMK